MIAIRRFGVEPNNIAAIVISHLHGDHFGGLPFFILDAQLVSRRERPLRIAGPKGLRERLNALMEAAFAGSTKAERKFEVEVSEFEPGRPQSLDPMATVVAAEIQHPSGAPALALRLDCDDRVIAYTGDTEWVEALIPIGKGADVLIAEAYTYDRRAPNHLDLATLRARLPAMAPKRVVLTHMSPDMLSRRPDELGGCTPAFDGMEIEV